MNIQFNTQQLLYKQSIAKATGVSKETAIYRVKKLEEKEIIGRYITLINFSKIGYTGYGVYCRCVNVNEELKQEIIDYLLELPELYWIALIGGKYDLVFGIMCKSVFEFNKIHYKIINKYGKHLADNTIAIRTELRQNKRDYLATTKRKPFSPPVFGQNPESIEIDNLDENILSILSINARMPVLKIAKILNTPASTITARIRKMETRKIIQGYSTYIRSQKYGKQSYRLFLYLQNMNESSRNKLFGYAYDNPFIVLAIETLGKWNFELTIEVDSHDHLQKEISSLRNSFNELIYNIEFIIMFENDLIYDPYPLKKKERKLLLQGNKQL